MDYSLVLRYVDDFMDKDPQTREHCPGTVNGHKLNPKLKQYDRRFRFFKRVKNIIYQLDDTDQFWYKSSKCNVSVMAMGFSKNRLRNHPKAVPMETYSKIFKALPNDYISEVKMTAVAWLKLNDFELIRST